MEQLDNSTNIRRVDINYSENTTALKININLRNWPHTECVYVVPPHKKSYCCYTTVYKKQLQFDDRFPDRLRYTIAPTIFQNELQLLNKILWRHIDPFYVEKGKFRWRIICLLFFIFLVPTIVFSQSSLQYSPENKHLLTTVFGSLLGIDIFLSCAYFGHRDEQYNERLDKAFNEIQNTFDRDINPRLYTYGIRFDFDPTPILKSNGEVDTSIEARVKARHMLIIGDRIPLQSTPSVVNTTNNNTNTSISIRLPQRNENRTENPIFQPNKTLHENAEDPIQISNSGSNTTGIPKKG